VAGRAQRDDPRTATAPVLVREHQHPPTPPARHDDVAGTKRVDRLGDATRRTPVTSERVELAGEAPILVKVAVVAARQRALTLEHLAAPLELAFERDDVAVGAELREREVEQVVRLGGRIAPYQVGGHVVRRAEAGREGVGAAGGQGGDLVEGHERAPADDGIPALVDAAAPGPSGELRVVARRGELVALAGE